MVPYRSLLSLCALCLLLVLPSQSAAAQDVTARQRAAEAVEDARYGEALTILQALIAANPDDPELLVLRGRAYEGREEYTRAIADYERALQLDPGIREADQGLQRAREGYNQATRGSLAGFRRLVAANPSNLQARLKYADALYDARQFREAAEQYDAYLDRTQGTPDVVRRYLIAIASYEGDNARGERVAEQYLQFYPSDDDLHMRLGYFRLWQGEYADARRAFEQALRLNPNNREARQGLDQATNPPAVQAGGPSQYPIDVLMRELRQNPNQDEKRFELADLLIDAGRYLEARQQLDVLAPRHQEESGWKQRYTLVVRRLEAGGGGQRGPSTFVVDELYKDLKRNPNQDDKRFELVRELIRYERYYEAYDQLQLLADRYDDTQRWLDLFARVDAGLIAETGSSPLYPIDRLTYRLKANPADDAVRYELVDALVDADRIAEAYEVLTQQPHADPGDAGYQQRMASVTAARERLASTRIAELEAVLADRPSDTVALRDLAGLYVQVRRIGDALALYERLLELNPADDESRYLYAQVLQQAGRYDIALQQADRLLQSSPSDPDYQRLYALTAVAIGAPNERAETYLRNLVEADPDDVAILLDLASLYLSQGNAEEADVYLRRALTVGDPAYAARIETMSQLVERELIRAEEATEFELLNDARRLAAADRFQEAIERYEAYFQAKGTRSRDELKELAEVYSAAGDYVTAISILEALQEEQYEYDVEKQIAKNRFYLQDYAGAVEVLERLIEQNPDDYEARLLLGDAYRELERFSLARAAYGDAETLAGSSETLEGRMLMLEARSTVGLIQSGRWTGYDYVGLIVPLAETIVARGSGIEYERWAQGIMTQVTVPFGAVVKAGLTSHFLHGSRRLIPNSEIVRERVNQVYAGGYLDLTPPLPLARASYTNRISVLGGLFDYEGGRTVGFGEFRYWRQEPGLYEGSIGLRTTEGSIELWSPAGGEFNLRLTQFDVRASTASVLADSVMRIAGVFAYNIVNDDYGGTGNGLGTNHGTNIQIDASYRILPFTYIGIQYYQLSYRNTVDIYFSPSDFETYSLWLEYEREYMDRWYFRLRGTIGLVARSDGFVSRRLESDLIYRLSRHFALTVNGSVGQSTRSLSDQAFSFVDRYNTFMVSASLLWTL